MDGTVGSMVPAQKWTKKISINKNTNSTYELWTTEIDIKLEINPRPKD